MGDRGGKKDKIKNQQQLATKQKNKSQKEVGQGAVQAIGRKHLGAINQPDERSTTA